MELKLDRPGFWMAVVLVLIALGIQILLAIPLAVIDLVFEHGLHQPRPDLARQPLVLACINLAAFGAAIALGLFLNRLSFNKAFPIGRITVAQLVSMAVVVIGIDVVLSEIDNVFRAVLPPPEWLSSFAEDLFFRHDRLMGRVVAIVVVAPVMEELLFRGIILRGLLGRFRPGPAILLTALLFAGIHLNPWQFCSALFLGCAFGWFYVRTGSIGLCILGHAFTNGLSVLFSSLPWHVPGLLAADMRQVEFQPLWLDAAALLILWAGVWGFRKATPPPNEPAPVMPPIIPPDAA